MKKLIFISGPTSVGKTSLAIDLALKYNLEIVSADSIQVYRYFNIGSAKPNKNELSKVKHHLIDIVDPWHNYTNACFIKDAKNAIDNIFSNNKYPIIVGGTGFYINSLIYGNYNTPISNIEIKKKLEEKYEKNKIKLYQELEKIDPDTAKNFHYNDKYRTVRALEIYYSSNKKPSYFKSKHQNKEQFKHLIFFITSSLEELKENIKNRTNNMIKEGLVEEVKNILKMPEIVNTKPLKSISYNEISLYLNNKISLQEAIELINTNTYKLVKRQITWFKKRKNTILIDKFNAYNIISNNIVNFYLKD
jgi:tRNA dimethylallyltransferase